MSDNRVDTLTWQCASLLLAYPDEEQRSQLALIGEVATGLSERVGGPLTQTATALRERPLQGLQEEYVATFDTRRRCSLFLTYFLHGDTRKRGTAQIGIGEIGAVEPRIGKVCSREIGAGEIGA